MRRFTVEDPVFKTEPLFVIDCSFSQFSQWMKRKYRLDVGLDIGQIGQMFTFDGIPKRVVWAQTLDPAVVMHEVFHLVTRICEDRGIPIKAHGEHGESNDEPAAFLFELFARKALKKCR